MRVRRAEHKSWRCKGRKLISSKRIGIRRLRLGLKIVFEGPSSDQPVPEPKGGRLRSLVGVLPGSIRDWHCYWRAVRFRFSGCHRCKLREQRADDAASASASNGRVGRRMHRKRHHSLRRTGRTLSRSIQFQFCATVAIGYLRIGVLLYSKCSRIGYTCDPGRNVLKGIRRPKCWVLVLCTDSCFYFFCSVSHFFHIGFKRCGGAGVADRTIDSGVSIDFALEEMLSTKRATILFYKKLHNARKNPEIAPSSYRHLREHGNAFFIVILELGFLAIILSWIKLFGSSLYWPLLLAVWIAPGAAVYFVGHVLEAEMVRKSQNVQESQ